MTFSRSDFVCSIILVGLVFCVLSGDSFGVQIEGLAAPIKKLKADVFGGWMIPVKILGGAASIVISFYKQSLIPFGIGVGSILGMSFFDDYLDTSASGLLI